MKLPLIPFKKKASDVESDLACHFALRISTSQLQAVIWQETGEGSKPHIVCRSRYIPWDTGDAENLARQADLALGECVSALPEHLEEPNDVLLGLPADWVNEGHVIAEYKQVIRDLMKALDLQAMGYVITLEALVNYLNSLGTGAVSAILVGVDDRLLEVGLAVQGQIQHLITHPNTGDLLMGVMNSISKLDASHLPPKIILFDGDTDLTRLQQGLIHQDWENKHLGFLHLPEVTYVPEHLPGESVVYSSVNQVQPAMGQFPHNPPVEPESTETGNSPQVNTAETTGTPVSTEQEIPQDSSLKQLGFVKDQDIKEVSAPAWDSLSSPPTQAFPGNAVHPVAHQSHHPEIASERHTIPQTTPSSVNHSRLSPLVKIPFMGKKETSDSKDNHQTSVRHGSAETPSPPIKFKKNIKLRIPWKLLLILLLVIGFMAGGGAMVYSRTKAELTLYVEPQLLEKAFSVKVNPDAEQSDPSNGLIKGQLLSTRINGTQTISTTGKTTVGEKAKGEVTVFNDTDTDRTLAAGTTITARDKQLAFTIDSEVTIASKSVDLSSDSPFKSGQAKIKVTASKIGPEYNLGAQTAFNVANFSSSVLLARNDQTFTGGSSREIQAVDKSDLEQATKQLLGSLESQAKDQLQQQLSGQQKLVDSSMEQEWVSRDFSHKVGDETNQLTLKGELKLDAVAYSEEDFHALAKERLTSEIPGDKEMAEHTSTNFTLVKQEDDGSYVFDVVTKTYLLPKLDADSVAMKLVGKSPSSAEEYLKSLPSVKETELNLSPRLPELLRRFPFKKESITVKIVPKTG